MHTHTIPFVLRPSSSSSTAASTFLRSPLLVSILLSHSSSTVSKSLRLLFSCTVLPEAQLLFWLQPQTLPHTTHLPYVIYILIPRRLLNQYIQKNEYQAELRSSNHITSPPTHAPSRMVSVFIFISMHTHTFYSLTALYHLPQDCYPFIHSWTDRCTLAHR